MKMKTKQKGNKATASFEFPVNRYSRAVFSEIIGQVRNSVIPLLRVDNRRDPYVDGSAILLKHGSQHLMITAEHVLERKADQPIFYFDSKQTSCSLMGEWRCFSDVDIAIKHLSGDELVSLAHAPFLDSGQLWSGNQADADIYAAVVGFPSNQSKLKGHGYIDTRMTAYGMTARLTANSKFVSVPFDKKGGVFDAESEEDITPTDPYGMSGGAIFALPKQGLQIDPVGEARLVGVATDWKKGERVILGANLITLLEKAGILSID